MIRKPLRDRSKVMEGNENLSFPALISFFDSLAFRNLGQAIGSRPSSIGQELYCSIGERKASVTDLYASLPRVEVVAHGLGFKYFTSYTKRLISSISYS